MGLRSQLGVAVEAEYGTGVTPDRFFEFNSETLERRNRTIQSNGIRAAGRNLRRGARRSLVGRDGGGNVVLEVGPDQFGVFFEHALGAVATTQPDATAAPTVYEHLFTFGSLLGKSLTIQKGVEQEDGTVVPFTFIGSKVAQLQIGVTVDQHAQMTLTVDSRDVDTATALAAAAFVDGRLFNFADSVITLGGTAVGKVRSFELTVANNLDVARYFLGNQGLKDEPKDNDYPAITGQLEVDFVDRATIYDVYAADAAVGLELGFVGDSIEGAFSEELAITAPEIRLGGQTPQVSGPQIPTLTVPFEAFYDGATDAIEVLLRNTDTTP